MSTPLSGVDPLTCPVSALNAALLAGSTTRDRAERAAVHLLVASGITVRQAVRECVYRHPATRALLVDWRQFSIERHLIPLSTGERLVTDLAVGLAADTPVRFLGSSLAHVDAIMKAEILAALAIAFGSEE